MFYPSILVGRSHGIVFSQNESFLSTDHVIIFLTPALSFQINAFKWAVFIYTGNPLHMNLQVVNFQRCEHVFHRCQVWVKLQLAIHLLLLMILQLYHLPPLLCPPVSNSSCLFTRCQPLCASCCTGLLYFSRYCTIRLKMLSLFLCLSFMYYLCKNITNLLQHSTI